VRSSISGLPPAAVPERRRRKYLEWREGVASANKPSDSVIELRQRPASSTPITSRFPISVGWPPLTTVTEQRRSGDELRPPQFALRRRDRDMSQGLCMFDAQEQMIVCNLNYHNMFGMSPEFVNPGSVWKTSCNIA